MMGGLDPRYEEVEDNRLDVLVKASPSEVAEIALRMADSFRAGSLRSASSPKEGASIGSVFRPAGGEWAQLFSPILPRGSMSVGQRLSAELGATALHAEAAADMWGGYAVFERGRILEIEWRGAGSDVVRIARDLGLPAPDLSDDELYEEATLEWADGGDGVPRGLDEALTRLGAWLDAGDSAPGDVIYLIEG